MPTDKALSVGGNVDRSVLIQGNGNHVTLIVGGASDAGRPVALVPSWRPPYEFDRKAQKEALSRIVSSAGVGVATLCGASGQGQRHVAEYLFQRLARDGSRARRIRIPDSAWPRQARLDVRLGSLCQQLASNLGLSHLGQVPSAPSELLSSLEAQPRAAHDRFVVQHTLLVPGRDDARLLEHYLQELWLPLLARKPPLLKATLVFELHLTPRSALARRIFRLLGLGDEGASRAMLRGIDAFARSSQTMFAPTPEHRPLSVDDLAVLYPHDLDDDAVQVRVKAQALYRATGGNFDAVVDHLFPQEAI